MEAKVGVFIIGLLLFTFIMAAVSSRGLPKVHAYSVHSAMIGGAWRSFSKIAQADVIDASTFVWTPGIVNKRTIARLIECESGWANVSAIDSDGIPSDGILQFHEDGTWTAMSRLSGITGNPMNPADAILMADWMISHGFIGRWTCAHILGMVR